MAMSSYVGRYLACGVLLVLVVFTFHSDLGNGFTDYDDNIYVTQNTQVQQGLTWENIGWAFRSTEAANWHPITWMSHMLDCSLFGPNPMGHHLTSLLFHAVNTALLFMLLGNMTGAMWRSFFVAALFGLHPLRVESVAWVAERKDVLGAFFWLLTMFAYANYASESKVQEPRSKVFYGLALLCFVLGLMSKPMLVTLPFALLLMDYWPLRRFDDRKPVRLFLEKVPFFLLAIAGSAITFIVQRNGGAVSTSSSFGARFANALVSYCRYVGKLFYPVDLALPYPRPDHWPAVTVLRAAFIVGVISLIAIGLRKRHGYVFVGWYWFLGTLVPVIGLVQAGTQAMADRYSYIPSIGFLLLIVWSFYDITRRWFWLRTTALAFAVAMIFLCIALTRLQIGYWKDSESLFRHAIEAIPDNWKAHDKVGVTLAKKGMTDEAIGHFQQALRIEPSDYMAYNDWGIALLDKGQFDAAIDRFQEALKLNPRDASAHYNWGLALAYQNHLNEAGAQFQEAVRLDPRHINAQFNWGLAFLREGQVEEAIERFQEALKLDPNHARAHYQLGIALLKLGRQKEATAHFNRTIELEPNNKGAREQLQRLTNQPAN